MKKFLHWKRKRLDGIVSNPLKLWITRIVLAGVLSAAVGEAWFARTTMVEGMERNRSQLNELLTLEDSVDAMRRTASIELLDATKSKAFDGVFRDWEDLAAWLEKHRKSALDRGWALEWQVTDPDAPGAYPAIQGLLVEFHLTLPEADFKAALEYLRKSTKSDSKRATLHKLEGIGDNEGISDLRWTLFVWVGSRRG